MVSSYLGVLVKIQDGHFILVVHGVLVKIQDGWCNGQKHTARHPLVVLAKHTRVRPPLIVMVQYTDRSDLSVKKCPCQDWLYRPKHRKAIKILFSSL